MADIRQVDLGRDRTVIQELLQEHLGWMNTRFSEEYAITFDVAPTVAGNLASLASYSPPDGCLLLAVAHRYQAAWKRRAAGDCRAR